MTKLLKVDVDGVLRDFTTAIYKTLKKHEPFDIPDKPPVCNEWDISKFYPDISYFWHKVFNEYAHEIFYGIAKPYKGAGEFYKKVSSKYDTIIRTHQPFNVSDNTIYWLRRYISDKITGIYISDNEQSKNQISGILIDDKPQNVYDNGEEKSVLLTRPWNTDVNVKHRADNYQDCLAKVDELMEL